jgi:hypothetical protein
MANVTPPEIRKARSFLFAQHKHGFRVPPRKFAAAAKELGVSFRELLRFISILQMRGQGAAAIRRENVRKIATRGS